LDKVYKIYYISHRYLKESNFFTRFRSTQNFSLSVLQNSYLNSLLNNEAGAIIEPLKFDRIPLLAKNKLYFLPFCVEKLDPKKVRVCWRKMSQKIAIKTFFGSV